MDRGIIYPGQVPLETDLLFAQKASMVGLAKLAAAILGTATVANGFATTQTTVPSLAVSVAAGEIYQMANIDGTAYSSIAADTTHQILKQGVALDATTLAITPPGTAGFSINYLIQATFAEVDGTPVVLPYYNASNPSTAYSGPANAGTTNNTRRAGTVVLTAKAGTAATTGTQTTPAPDANNIGLYVVTVANGAASVLNANISTYSGAQFIGSTLLPLDSSGKPASTLFSNAAGSVVGSMRNAVMSVTAASASATFTADEVVVETALGGAPLRLPNFNKTINLATTGAGGMDTGTAPVSGFVALYAIYNPNSGASALLATNSTAAAAPNVYGGVNMPAGYTASALVSVWITNASSQFGAGYQIDRTVNFAQRAVYTSTTLPSTATLLSIASAVPKNARIVYGNIGGGGATVTTVYSLYLAADSNLQGFQQSQGYTAAGGAFGCNYVLPLVTPQTLYFYGNSTSGISFSIIVTGYTF